MKHPILTLTRNCLALTRRCVESCLAQNIPTRMFVLDNASTDGTAEWLSEQWITHRTKASNIGVSAGWNEALDFLFEDADSVLVVGNDTWLAPKLYETLLNCKLPFVTGVAVDNMKQANETAEVYPLEPRPDFSCFCIRRDCWEKVGRFDEQMKLYSSDQDYHLRAHRKGINLYKAAVPFYHERSSTLNLAPAHEQVELLAQANCDRAVLKNKWGVSAGGPDYEALFSSENFGIDAFLLPHESACGTNDKARLDYPSDSQKD